MKTFFKQLRIFQIISILNFVVLVMILSFCFIVSVHLYKNLPEGFPLRSKLKIGKILAHFETAHMLYDWRKLDIPVYDLTIKENKLKKILNDLPGEDSLMTDEYKQYSPALFLYANKEYKVKTRFRGLCPNHWRDEKKSWRIKFNTSNLLEGKKSLNLIIPQDRGFFAEYLSNHIARKIGLWVPDDKFVFLRVNGLLQGIYYETEQVTEKFLELHGKVDAANFFHEDSWNWNEYGFDPIFTDVGHWKKYTSETVSKFDDSSELAYLLNLLSNADDSRFYMEIPVLINMDNFLLWQAHSMIMGSYHQSEHGNMNLYFNIINGKFEFMPYDVSIYPIDGQFFDKAYNPLVERILKNKEFLHRRNIVLWQYISSENYHKDDLEFYDRAYARFRKGFYSDRGKGFTNTFFNNEVKRLRSIFSANRRKIMSNLNFASVFANIHLFPSDTRVLAALDMVSGGFSAATLQSIKFSFSPESESIAAAVGKNIEEYSEVSLYYDSNNSGLFDTTDKLVSKFTIDIGNNCFESELSSFLLYPGRDKNLQPAKELYRFFVVSDQGHSKNGALHFEFSISNAVTGNMLQPRYHYIDDRFSRDFPKIVASRDNFLEEFPIFKHDLLNPGSVILPAGEYQIQKNIISPLGISITIEPGVTLKFHKNASFISNGRILAKGTKDKPIIFTAVDTKEPWGNFAVVGHETDGSRFEYVIAEYAGESFINGISFTGALAIHNAKDVEINNCIIRYTTGDDAINTKNGESVIRNSVFYKNPSDAIDYDFSKGSVENNYIKDNGGDGVDLCRTDCFINGNRIEGSGDKGISVGEASNPIIVNNLIRLCNIGIASKDLSRPIIINDTIIDNKNGIEAYMKKSIFGPAYGLVRNTILWNNVVPLKIESGSKINFSDSLIQGGYAGKNIVDFKPIFINAEKSDYRISQGSVIDKTLLSSDSLDALHEVKGYEDIKEAPLGILSNPKILTVSDFSEEK